MNEWTERELSKARKMAKAGFTSKATAKALGRGHPALRFKAITVVPKIRFGRK